MFNVIRYGANGTQTPIGRHDSIQSANRWIRNATPSLLPGQAYGIRRAENQDRSAAVRVRYVVRVDGPALPYTDSAWVCLADAERRVAAIPSGRRPRVLLVFS